MAPFLLYFSNLRRFLEFRAFKTTCIFFLFINYKSMTLKLKQDQHIQLMQVTENPQNHAPG